MSEQVPEADAAEQAAALVDEEDEGAAETADSLSRGAVPQADEGDVAEQIRVVALDEEDYR